MKYKVGDRVRVISTFDGYNLKGKMGTVVELGKSCRPFEIGVAFDEPFLDGHTCSGNAAAWHGRYGMKDELALVDENRKIVITSNGVETLARLYEGNKVVMSATAKCSPDDTFVFEEGARIAFHRLIGDYAEIKAEKPKYYNGKVVCVKPEIDMTVGKVYEIKNGKLLDDVREERPFGRPEERILSLDEGWAKGRVIPFVERVTNN